MSRTTTHLPLRVLGLGAALPGTHLPGARLSNEGLSRCSAEAIRWLSKTKSPRHLEPCSADFPRERIGVLERRILDERFEVRDLAVAAARDAMAKGASFGTPPLGARLRAIVVSTVSSAAPVPAVALSVAGAVQAPPEVLALDLTLGCSGFMAALDVALGRLADGQAGDLALVVGAEAMSRVLDVADRGTLPIFGDGAGALLIEKGSDVGHRVAFHNLPEHGSKIRIAPLAVDQGPLLRLTAKGGRVEVAEDLTSRLVVHMEGRAVFRDMVRLLPGLITEYLESRSIRPRDLGQVIFHQANSRLVAAVAKATGFSDQQVPMNIARLGNTTSASIPLLLHEASTSGRLRPNQDLLLVGFGTGYSVCLNLLRWS